MPVISADRFFVFQKNTKKLPSHVGALVRAADWRLGRGHRAAEVSERFWNSSCGHQRNVPKRPGQWRRLCSDCVGAVAGRGRLVQSNGSDPAILVTYLLPFEVVFYYAHRLFHTQALYSRFHKVHHRFTEPIDGVEAIDMHVVDFLCTTLLPLLSGPWLFGTTPAIFAVWTSLALANGIKAHSAYSQSHLLHHKLFRVNYGFLGVMDWLHGTLRA